MLNPIRGLTLYRERLPRIWTKLGGNSSYKPPGASYIAQGPYILQGNEKMRERNLYENHEDSFCIPLYFRLKGPIQQCWPPTRMKRMNHPIFATFSLELGWNCVVFPCVLQLFAVFAIFCYVFHPIRWSTLVSPFTELQAGLALSYPALPGPVRCWPSLDTK